MKKNNKILIGIMIILCFISFNFFSKINVLAENVELYPNEKLVIDKINSSSQNELNVYFFENTGEDFTQSDKNGDCCIVTMGDTEILIDAGPEAKVAPIIMRKMRSLVSKDKVWDYVIATHGDSDHISCFGQIFSQLSIENYKFGTIIDFDINSNDADYSTITCKNEFFLNEKGQLKKSYKDYVDGRDKLIKNGTKYYSSLAALKKKNFSLGKATMTILDNYFYNHRYNDSKKVDNVDRNLISLCFIIKYKNQKLLFTGDLMQYNTPNTSGKNVIEVFGETKLFENNKKELEDGVTFYKAAHHGSGTSNCRKFIDIIRPQYVVIPCVAGTSENSTVFEDNTIDKTPMYNVMTNMFKYTDQIFMPSMAVLDESGKTIGTRSYYGDILLQFDGKEVLTFTTNESDENHKANNIQDTSWFKENSLDSIYIYTLDEGVSSYQNCTLIRYGHYDILIDCGSDSGGINFVRKLKNYCRDGIIEYLIVSGSTLVNFSQIIGPLDKKGKPIGDGVIGQFEIGNILDFGNDKTIQGTTDEGMCGVYKKLVSNGGYINFKNDKEINITENLSLKVIRSNSNDSKDPNSLSMTTIINFYNSRFLFTGSLNYFDHLIENYEKEIENVSFYRAPTSTSLNNNLGAYDLDDFYNIINPKFTVIGTTLNRNTFDSSYIHEILSHKGIKDSHTYPISYQDGNGNYKKINSDITFISSFLNGELKRNQLFGTPKGAILLENVSELF